MSFVRRNVKLPGQVFHGESMAMYDPNMLSLRQLLEKARQGMDISPFVRVSDDQFDSKGDLSDEDEFNLLDSYDELRSYNHYGPPTLDELYDAQRDLVQERERSLFERVTKHAKTIAEKLSKRKAAPPTAQPRENSDNNNEG